MCCCWCQAAEWIMSLNFKKLKGWSVKCKICRFTLDLEKVWSPLACKVSALLKVFNEFLDVMMWLETCSWSAESCLQHLTETPDGSLECTSTGFDSELKPECRPLTTAYINIYINTYINRDRHKHTNTHFVVQSRWTATFSRTARLQLTSRFDEGIIIGTDECVSVTASE